ncbi:MAG: hypothetical protein R2822_08520 [Spirosomataceae bacterium]
MGACNGWSWRLFAASVSRIRRFKVALSNRACQAAKPKIKSYKMADGEGTRTLEVHPAKAPNSGGSNTDLLAKKNGFRLVPTPMCPIVGARQAKEEIKKEIKAGIDPS